MKSCIWHKLLDIQRSLRLLIVSLNTIPGHPIHPGAGSIAARLRGNSEALRIENSQSLRQ